MVFLKFLDIILQDSRIRGFLGKNLGKILTKKSKNIQDSYQEFQEFLHWVALSNLMTLGGGLVVVWGLFSVSPHHQNFWK